jgi:hypothetical protein
LEYLRGVRRVGLPIPTRQRIVKRRHGRYYLDCEFDPYEVTVEINGAQHIDLLTKEADDVRRVRLAIGGRLMVDIGSYIVRRDNDLAMLITAELLRSRGWVPAPHVAQGLRELAASEGFNPSLTRQFHRRSGRRRAARARLGWDVGEGDRADPIVDAAP